MKKIYMIFAVLAAMLTIGSCTDDLDQKPVIGIPTETVYGSVEGYRSVLAKIYASYSIIGAERGGGSADMSTNKGQDILRTMFYLQECPTDAAAYKYNSGDNLQNITYMKWDPTDVWVSDAYYRLYYVIALANDFLRNSSEGKIAAFSDAEKEILRGYSLEARFMRALSYAYVLDLFRQGPMVTEDSPTTSFMPEAYDGKKLYDFIIGEIDEIAPLLPAHPEYPRAGQGAAYALGARVALNGEVYTGTPHYTESIGYCKKVMALGYSLEQDFTKLFNADNDKRTNEIIFAFASDNANSATWGSATNIIMGSCPAKGEVAAARGIGTGWGSFTTRGEFIDLYDDGDKRFLFYTDDQEQYFDGSIEAQDRGYWCSKWTNLDDNGQQACQTDVGVNTDYPIFRLSEIYLTAAEAVLRKGEGMSRAEALDLVNEVRKRAYGDDSSKISDAQFDPEFILDERGREFVYELLRRSDLVRFNRFTTEDYGWQWRGGVIDGMAVNDKFNIYPIPQSELSANTNLKNEHY